jgi:hypothetical protein
MMIYTQKLIDEGITPFRAEKVAEAMLSLHEALSRLDIRNLKLFISVSLEERFSDFSRLEEMRDVINPALLE